MISDLDCMDCERFSEPYMVTNDVWLQAVPDYVNTFKARRLRERRTLLCFFCLARRLGRDLTMADFTPAEINMAIRFGWRMREAELRVEGRSVYQTPQDEEAA